MGYKSVVRTGDTDTNPVSGGDKSLGTGGLQVDEAGNAKGADFQGADFQASGEIYAVGNVVVEGQIITLGGMLSGELSGLEVTNTTTTSELIAQINSDVGTRSVGGGVSALGGTVLAIGGGGSVEVNANGGDVVHIGAKGGGVTVNENFGGNILAVTGGGGFVEVNKQDGDTEQANSAGGFVITNDGGTTPIYINSPQGNAVDCVTNLAKSASGSGTGTATATATSVGVGITSVDIKDIEEPDENYEPATYDKPNWFGGFPRTDYIEDDRNVGVRHTYLEYEDRFSDFVPPYIPLPFAYDDPNRPSYIPEEEYYYENIYLDPKGLGGFIYDPTVLWGPMENGEPELNAIYEFTIPPTPDGSISYKLNCYSTPDFLAEHFKDFDPECSDQVSVLYIQNLDLEDRVIPKGTFCAKNHKNIKWEIMRDQPDFDEITEATFVDINRDTGLVTGQIPYPADGVYQEWGVRIGIRDITTNILLNWKVFKLYRYIPLATPSSNMVSVRGINQDYSTVTGTFVNPLGPGAKKTGNFGAPRSHGSHNGTDHIPGPGGSNRLGAVDGGTVTDVSWWGGGGKTVLIDHGTHTSAQMHMSSTNVEVGDVVTKGQVIGIMGNTGANSRGAHVHTEIVKKANPNALGDKSVHLANRENGRAVDPDSVMGTGTVPHDNDHDHDHDHDHANEEATPCAPAGSGAARIADIKDKASPKQLEVIERMEAEMDRAGLSDYDKAYMLDLAQVESNFNPNASARKNGLNSSAEGLYQFVDGTAREVGVNDKFNIEDNTRGGIAYVAKADKAYDYFKASGGDGLSSGQPISRDTAARYNTYTKNQFRYAFHHNGPGNMQKGKIPVYNGKKMDGAQIWARKKGT